VSDPTLNIRVQLKQGGKAIAQRTIEVAVLKNVEPADLSYRASRRTGNAVDDILEDADLDVLLGDHSPSNDDG
jgi:hypothetical protein